MRILVTGGNGFLGSHLAAALVKDGHSVRVFGRTRAQSTDVEGFQGDITDADALQKAATGCQAVFHTASKVGMGASDEFFRVNVLGAKTVAQVCRRAGVPFLVYTSTPSVVFNGKPIAGGNETLPYGNSPISAYARTKALAEHALLAQADASLKICALRPHLIFGKGDPHLLPGLVAAAQSGRLKRVGNGHNKVDITHISSAVHAHQLALEALQNGRANGKAYFISQGEPVLLWPWIDHVLGKLGQPPIGGRIPYWATYGLGFLCEPFFKGKKQPPMTRFIAAMLAHDHFFDISAARKDLGYAPVVATEDGLNLWAADFKKNMPASP